MNINVALADGTPASSLPVEIVERKGKGHPDSICDALADELSNTLSRAYLDRFGSILHHNVDKALLWGGAALPVFGGGEVLQPIEIFLAGRATEQFRGVRIPLEELAMDSTQRWLQRNLHALDSQRHVRIHCLFRPASSELMDLYQRPQAARGPLASDTSVGVGYAPLDELESAVLQVERHLNSASVKASWPAIGEDIKVMGVRSADSIALTVACAVISRHIPDMSAYVEAKAKVAQLAHQAARVVSASALEIKVNNADGDSPESVYLTVTGTSAEAGDDGEVGRGNRANGLITPYRPMNMEAPAGKNPVSHVGKIYNVAANRIANAVVAQIAEVQEACCWLVSEIGRPISDPQVAEVKVRLKEGVGLETVQPRVREIAADHLARIGELWREMITGSLPVW